MGCGAIQPPPARADLFSILGLPRRWHQDGPELEAAWREVTRKVHPDRFAGRPAVERRMSLQWTALLGEARRVLRDPVSRARYLASGRTRPPEEGGPVLDPEFLEEMFELRMAADLDPDSVLPRAEAWRQEILDDLARIFGRWEAGQGGLDEVEERLARLKYLDNLVASAHR